MLSGIVYYSEVTKPFTMEDLRSLSGQSEQDNASAGITGMLLYVEDHFLQYIEGEEDVLLPLIEKIRTDKRHTVLREFKSEPLTKRRFPDWHMRWLMDSDLQETHLHEQLGTCFLKNGGDEAAYKEAIWKLVDGLAAVSKSLGKCC